MGANDGVCVDMCGVRGRGKDHIHGFSRVQGADIAAVCDVDESVLNQRLGDVEKLGVPKPKSFVDVRKLLEDKDIDAISIATPNHWHSLTGLWTCHAGKDVYVEKPFSTNTFEGRQIGRAVKKYNRICQHGSQSRSNPGMLEAIHHLSDGTIGDVYMARALCYKWRPTIGHATEEPVPAGVNYDLWTGPAPLKPFTRNRFHYTWHWIWDTGNGEVGNQAIHEIDIARWCLTAGFPSSASSLGGHFMFDDHPETRATLHAAARRAARRVPPSVLRAGRGRRRRRAPADADGPRAPPARDGWPPAGAGLTPARQRGSCRDAPCRCQGLLRHERAARRDC